MGFHKVIWREPIGLLDSENLLNKFSTLPKNNTIVTYGCLAKSVALRLVIKQSKDG